MRAAVPYLFILGMVATVTWAVSFGTLPPADFTFSNGGEIKTVDPALVTGSSEGRIVRSLFEGLTTWDPKDLSPQPGVAESWEISEDRRTYTFKIRKDARWSDGTLMTAEDFHWSYRRFLHPATAAEYSGEMWYIEGAKKFTTAKVEVGDPVEIELDTPPPDDRPFAQGKILRGTLVDVKPPFDEKKDKKDKKDKKEKIDRTYTVEIDGRQRTFSQSSTVSAVENYRWLIYDFDSVGLKVLDERTIQFRLDHPVPYFLNLVGFYPMSPVNRTCFETHGYPAWTKPANIVVNGPFLLEFRRIRDRIRMKKNPHYWDRDNVRLETIDALAVESYPTNLNLYLTGQVDWIPMVPVEVVPELIARKQGDFKPAPFLANYHYLINTAKPPLDDARVRRALALAINKQEIVERVTRAGQLTARSIVPESIAEWVPYTPQECGEYNVKEARRLLAEAGYPNGQGFRKIEILYNTSEAHQAIAELIQSHWKRNLGINVGLKNQEWSVYLSNCRKGDFDVARHGWIADYPDPITFLVMFTSSSSLNHTKWDHPQYNRLIEQSKYEPDTAKRMDQLQQAERILMDELPVVPIYAYVTQNMIRPYVKGFYPNIQDVHPLKGVWIDRKAKDRILREEGLR